MDDDYLRRRPGELHDDCAGLTQRMENDLAQLRAQLDYVNGELDRCMIERHEMSKELGALIRQCMPLGYVSGQGISISDFIIAYVSRMRINLSRIRDDFKNLAGSESHLAGGVAGAASRLIDFELRTDIWHAPFNETQISMLRMHQHNKVHPYTCGADSSHLPLSPDVAGLICREPGCGYIQTWAHNHFTLKF